MNGKHKTSCTLALFGAAILSSSLTSSFAQTTRLSAGSHARADAVTAKRAGNRRLVKIRARAGDTLNLLADRFGSTVEEIASVNGVSSSAQVQTGQELLIPLPSPEALSRPVKDNASGDAGPESEWVNVNGVLFRKGSSSRAIEASVTTTNDDGRTQVEPKEKSARTLAKVVDVSEAEQSSAAQLIWIYLTGGARVEADSVNETSEGVWYKHGNLSIFIERSRIERVERERPASVADSTGAWAERGWTTGNAKFDTLIRENGTRFGVDPYLIFCVMEQESQFKPYATSPVGARGLMQLMPGTAARMGVRHVFDPAENIMGGTRYLKMLLDSFNGRVDLVLAGYNAGEGAVLRYGGNVPPFRETRNYVQRISKRYGQTRSFTPPAPEASLVTGMK